MVSGLWDEGQHGVRTEWTVKCGRCGQSSVDGQAPAHLVTAKAASPPRLRRLQAPLTSPPWPHRRRRRHHRPQTRPHFSLPRSPLTARPPARPPALRETAAGPSK
eukprot:365300-Chlamydomonas_euryale.AAC.18